jgi:hypothetical protein
MGSLVECGDLEGASRASGSFLKDECDIFAFQALRLDASVFGCFQVCCEPQHIRNFLRSEI